MSMKRDEKTILEHVEILSISLTSFQPLGTEILFVRDNITRSLCNKVFEEAMVAKRRQ